MKQTLKQRIDEIMAEIADDIIAFASKTVQIKSMTCQEKEMASLIENKMRKLGYNQVVVDDTGNVLGRIGSGEKILLFDSHMDTVTVIDEDQWDVPPYGGIVKDGRIYGRGAVDMKCPLTASLYGAYIAKRIGLPDDISVYVSASVMEEDFDGEAVRQLLLSTGLKPDSVVICEPTSLKIATGHRGRALIEIKTQGKACHASSPEKGVNPVYMMEEIIGRVKSQARILDAKQGDKGSVALTNIYCSTASNNSVPQDASIILDRRLALGESEEVIAKEMDGLTAGTEGRWCFSDIPAKSWTGKEFVFHSFLPAWKIDADHPLVLKAMAACELIRDEKPELFQMGASTNGVTTAGIFHLPTIVLGPGDLAQAHGVNEYCEVDSMLNACKIYAALCAGGWT